MTLRPLVLIGALALSATALSGCGKMGELERPGPIGQARSGSDAGSAPMRSIRTVDPRDRNSDPAPQRTEPIESTNDPMASGPQGAIPDPYARPR
ncbi:MAG: hypothetical protein Q8N10_00325 [Phenylobacterium sp.]|uniref:hypothetical protein n=1 Tax=Phenylobacterium sp. TaxID=1871053 RepID=UPI002726729F|nr:hypothetical protein [Phenylobacterium sp.]MDO8911463.1 hypothetical protein [Phenylobacterium sp.]MDP3098923.1 hypothetical protein [Phenylobacterium sp.]